MTTEALRSSRPLLTTAHSLKTESSSDAFPGFTRSKSHLDFGRELSRVSKIDIEFRRTATTVKSADGLDTADAQFKISSYLNQFLCHFTQNFSYNKQNIRDHLDILSMECSIIPCRCRAAYYNLMGYFYASLEKRCKADRYFDLALKLNPDDTVAYVNKAMNYLKTNEVIKCYPLIRRLKEIQNRPKHLPGSTPLSVAQNTIALAYNKLGLSCAALHYYQCALKTDPFNFDNYLGKSEVLLKMSQHQGRANTLETLNDAISSVKKYISEYNVLNLARESDERESPLPRDNKAVNNVHAVIILARALNERSRKMNMDYLPEGLEMIELALQHSEGNAYTLYQLGDELRLMGRLDGPREGLNLLREAIDLRESPLIYHSYALAILSYERNRYQERFRAPSKMTTVTSVGGGTTVVDVEDDQESRKKSLKQPSSKSDKHPKQFVFDGDDELKGGMIKVAKLLKHALKISASVSTSISLDLVELYCSLNRRSEAEVMFNAVNVSPNQVERETANRKMGMFYIKIGEFEKADCKIEESLRIISQITPEDTSVMLGEMEDTVQLLVDHFTQHDNNGRGKFWHEQLLLLNPSLAEDQGKSGQKSSKTRK